MLAVTDRPAATAQDHGAIAAAAITHAEKAAPATPLSEAIWAAAKLKPRVDSLRLIHSAADAKACKTPKDVVVVPPELIVDQTPDTIVRTTMITERLDGSVKEGTFESERKRALTTRADILAYHGGDSDKAAPMLAALARYKRQVRNAPRAKADREEDAACAVWMEALNGYLAAVTNILHAPVTTVAEAQIKLETFIEMMGEGRGLDDGADYDAALEAARRDLARLACHPGAPATPPSAAAWCAASLRLHQARAALDAMEAEDDTAPDYDDRYEAVDSEHIAAIEALLNTRAPDAFAIGMKVKLIVRRGYDGDISDPAFVSHMLAKGWDEHLLAAVYQDSLALSGIDDEALAATADTFDPTAWLTTVEAETGARLVLTDGYSPRVHFDGGNAADATERLAALPEWHAFAVESEAERRGHAERQREATARVEALPPTPPEELQAIFAQGLVNSTPEDQREAVMAALTGLGITPRPFGAKADTETAQ